MFDSPLLAIYLNDHLSGAVVGVELARRTARNNRGTPYGTPLARLAEEIAEDRKTLEMIMRRLDIGIDRGKVTLAWGAEKLGRLKLNGRVIGYSPLSRVEELELLAVGVEGKLALWRTFTRGNGLDARLAEIDFSALLRRAQSQRRRLERQRVKAAGEAFP
jgi:hypothetical protein